MGHGRGVAVLAAARANIEVFEYTPPSGKTIGGRLWKGRKNAGTAYDKSNFKS